MLGVASIPRHGAKHASRKIAPMENSGIENIILRT
jgi:hypothetical protein